MTRLTNEEVAEVLAEIYVEVDDIFSEQRTLVTEATVLCVHETILNFARSGSKNFEHAFEQKVAQAELEKKTREEGL